MNIHALNNLGSLENRSNIKEWHLWIVLGENDELKVLKLSSFFSSF